MFQSGKGKGAPPPPPSSGKAAASGKGKAARPTDEPSSEEEICRKAICEGLKDVPFFDPAMDAQAFHGRAYINCGPTNAPSVTWASDKKPREHSAEWLTATEYEDEPDVLKAKVALLGSLLRISHKTVAYTGAGLSVAAGVRMAAIGSAVAKPPEKAAAGDRQGADQDTETSQKLEQPSDVISEEAIVEHAQKGKGKGKAGYSVKGKMAPPAAPKQLGKGKPPPKHTPELTTEALPTSLHYVMADLNHRGLLHGWVQQNHDCLPQKAGYRQEDIVEIHGSWYDPSHQVVKYSGGLRDDAYNEMSELTNSADLCLVMGTSLTGLTSDRVATKPAINSQYGRTLGTVIISPQRTSEDGKASLRIFSKAEPVMQMLVSELGLTPSYSVDGIFPKDLKVVVPYDRHGIRSTTVQIVWDLSPNQKVHLGSHHNSQLANQPDSKHLTWNDEGEVLPLDRDNFCIPLRFPQAPGVRGQIDGPVVLKLGVWWLSAAQRGGVARLPVVNKDAEETAITTPLA